MKIKQIVDALPSLRKIAGQDMSIKKLYRISKLLSALDVEMEFYNEQRMKILEKYCDINNGQYVPKPENVEQINTEFSELLDTDVECDIKEVVLESTEDLVLSYNDLVALKGFVRIGED